MKVGFEPTSLSETGQAVLLHFATSLRYFIKKIKLRENINSTPNYLTQIIR